MANYSVWSNGIEINNYALSLEKAEELAERMRQHGYKDVVVSEFKLYGGMSIEEYNLKAGNLSLEDTEDLIEIVESLSPYSEARRDLEEFIARRGYNENPIPERMEQ